MSPDRVHGSAGVLTLRAALKRGALVAAANWPVILAQFVSVSMFRLALAVPVVGGVFVVAVLAQASVRSVFADGIQATSGLIIASLLHRPAALLGFVGAVALVGVGGGAWTCLVQAGVCGTLTRGERSAGAVHRPPLSWNAIQQAAAFDIASFVGDVRSFGRRFVLVGAWVFVSYTALALVGIGVLVAASRLAGRLASTWVMPATALAVVAMAMLAVAALRLFAALIQAVITTDRCDVGVAVRRVGTFVYRDVRQVLGVFGVVMVVALLATAGSVLATAGLALVAWVPFVGLAVVPLQLAAWLVRGVVFHYLDLVAWSAYQSHYRRYAEPEVSETGLHAARVFGA